LRESVIGIDKDANVVKLKSVTSEIYS